MPTFQYHPDILTKFPDVSGGVILANGMRNGPTPEGLAAAYVAEQQAVLAHIGNTPLSEIESLSAWRSAFRAFGVEPTQYRSAAEALLRRLTKKGDIPSINLLVDLGNLVSIRYGLPVAVFDTNASHGALTVRFADGSERFTTLGERAVEHPEPGEVVFSDETGLVFARRWCWRQSDESAARETTTDAIITMEAHHVSGKGNVQAALDDTLVLLKEYTGGNFTSGVLGHERAGISA
jgi:DNA/RNA-binding domain of Phe-tRNA-synthetase-like protein